MENATNTTNQVHGFPMPDQYVGKLVIYLTTESDRSHMKFEHCKPQHHLPATIVAINDNNTVNLKVMQDGPVPDKWIPDVSATEKEGGWIGIYELNDLIQSQNKSNTPYESPVILDDPLAQKSLPYSEDMKLEEGNKQTPSDEVLGSALNNSPEKILQLDENVTNTQTVPEQPVS